MPRQTFLADFVSNTGKPILEHRSSADTERRVLELLADGCCQSLIAEKLGKPRNSINYWVRKLEKQGKIKRKQGVYPYNFDVLVSVPKSSSTTRSEPRVARLGEWEPHHFKVLFKFEGVQPSAGATKSWGMRNWRVFEWSQYPSVTVIAKPRTLEVVVWKAEGASIEERVEAGYRFARRFAEWFARERGLTLVRATPLALRHWVLDNEKLSKRVISLLDLKGNAPVQGLTTDLSHVGKVEAHGAEGEAAAKRLEKLVSGELQAQVKATNDWLAGEVNRLQNVVADLVLEVQTLKERVGK